MNGRNENSERGQSIVLIALLIIGMMGIVALAIDGGNALNERRVTQNAADASALSGVWFIVKTPNPEEDELLSRVHHIIESHNIPDSDGIPGNEINDNVTVIYTDHEGNHLLGCHETPCGSVPHNVSGLEVNVRESFPTFIAGVIGFDEVSVSADAIAVVIAGSEGGFASGMSMLSLAPEDECSLDDKPIDVSGSDEEVLGASHSNSYIDVSGSSNHFHGLMTYVGGMVEPGSGMVYEPEAPGVGPEIGLPAALVPVSVDDFAPGGSQVIHLTPGVDYLDVSSGGKVDKGKLESMGLYNSSSHALDDGVYWAGNQEIDLGDSEMHGHVTFVGHNEIVLSGSEIQLSTYYEHGHNILLYTDYQPSEPCKDRAISISGSSNNVDTFVSHSGECPDVDPLSGCWTASDNLYEGLLYAPRGKVETNGSHTTYWGGILAYTIKLNGSNELLVGNPNIFAPTVPFVLLYQ